MCEMLESSHGAAERSGIEELALDQGSRLDQMLGQSFLRASFLGELPPEGRGETNVRPEGSHIIFKCRRNFSYCHMGTGIARRDCDSIDDFGRTCGESPTRFFSRGPGVMVVARRRGEAREERNFRQSRCGPVHPDARSPWRISPNGCDYGRAS